MRRIILTILLILVIIPLGAHPWKPRHYVIIDSDGGIDDLKAICMLMASPDVRILAITTSDGFYRAPVAYEKIRSLADGLHHEGLPVAGPGEAVKLIDKMLASETTTVKFIALGSLETAALATEQLPSFTVKVKQIYWSNSGLPGKDGSNYKSDPAAAEKVLSGNCQQIKSKPFSFRNHTSYSTPFSYFFFSLIQQSKIYKPKQLSLQ